MNLTLERCYALGLLIGGGTIANKTFHVVLPFDKWGENPHTMSSIARDILVKLDKVFFSAYSTHVVHHIENKRWAIVPVSVPDLKPIVSDLESLGLPHQGFLLDKADLAQAMTLLTGALAEQFLTGIFDARASLAKSHRRFTTDAPIVSLEIPGSTQNFVFVVQLCSWLTSLGSITDQILFNHPCQHSPSDPFYSGWKKGFKIRLLAKSFIANNSFLLSAKASDAQSLSKQQKKSDQTPCKDRKPRQSHSICIHSDISSHSLPEIVRNKLFFHYHHICAIMGCKFAPYENLKPLVNNAFSSVSIFPICRKGDYETLLPEFKTSIAKYFPQARYLKKSLSCSKIVGLFPHDLYPAAEKALAFLLSATIMGKRHRGTMSAILLQNKNHKIGILKLSAIEGAPLFLYNVKNGRAAYISAPNTSANTMALKSCLHVKGLEVLVHE